MAPRLRHRQPKGAATVEREPTATAPHLDSTTLSDAAPDAAASGPVFAEPWQARAFAIAVLASKQGCFTWSEWTHALGRELHRAQDVDAQGATAGYFNCWLSALQS